MTTSCNELSRREISKPFNSVSPCINTGNLWEGNVTTGVESSAKFQKWNNFETMERTNWPNMGIAAPQAVGLRLVMQRAGHSVIAPSLLLSNYQGDTPPIPATLIWRCFPEQLLLQLLFVRVGAKRSLVQNTLDVL